MLIKECYSFCNIFSNIVEEIEPDWPGGSHCYRIPGGSGDRLMGKFSAVYSLWIHILRHRRALWFHDWLGKLGLATSSFASTGATAGGGGRHSHGSWCWRRWPQQQLGEWVTRVPPQAAWGKWWRKDPRASRWTRPIPTSFSAIRTLGFKVIIYEIAYLLRPKADFLEIWMLQDNTGRWRVFTCWSRRGSLDVSVPCCDWIARTTSISLQICTCDNKLNYTKLIPRDSLFS